MGWIIPNKGKINEVLNMRIKTKTKGFISMLEQIQLPPQYKVGHEKIDEQHSQLFVILMHLVKLIKNENKKNDRQIDEELNELLRHLRSYTQNHFNYEEHYMEKMKYPHLDAHKDLHKTFLSSLIEIQKNALKFKKEKQEVLKDMALFLKNWYLKHILEEDKRIILFEKERGAQTPKGK